MKVEKTGRLVVGVLVVLVGCSHVWASWSEPVLMPELNAPGGDVAGCSRLSSDGLTMYFFRHIPAYGYLCIVEAYRSSPAGPFTSERILSELRVSGGHVSTPWISDDELRLYYFETVLGVRTIKMARRSTTTESWTPVKTFDELHTGGYNGTVPSLSGDELTIIWNSGAKPGGAGLMDMWMATRPSTDVPFGNIRPLHELNTSQNDSGPWLLPDGLTLYFCSVDRDGDSGQNIYRATRSFTYEAFGNVQLVQLPDTQSVDEGFPFVTSDEKTLFYWLAGQGVFATYWSEPVMPINLDIKPQSCPNPFNVNSKGLLPVAIPGSETVDVFDIDIDSIQLAGVSPIRSNYEDVATGLVDPIECECSTEGPDGYIDLTLKFEIQAIADALGEAYHGEEFILYLTGYLYDGTPIEGSDCIIVRRKGK